MGNYYECSIHGCEDGWEFPMLSWNGWPMRVCPFHAADWDCRELAKLRTEVGS